MKTPIREWIQSKALNAAIIRDFGDSGSGGKRERCSLELALEHHGYGDQMISKCQMDGLMPMKKLGKYMLYVSFIILLDKLCGIFLCSGGQYLWSQEVFLKSELRGQDILEALLGDRERAAALLEAYEEDCYSNGYLESSSPAVTAWTTMPLSGRSQQKHHFMEELTSPSWR